MDPKFLPISTGQRPPTATLDKIRNLTWDTDLSLEQSVAISLAIDFAVNSPEFQKRFGTFTTDQLKSVSAA